ncbi:hypothetical protein PPERSA_06253 [Pseudocohnilembus persalinus]|uniref:Uncharacterized protein n=1 Tax=Pseudocohnilembus persalinus TaxID=266149 RepID=A0A0V0QW45_PSEPJ|nr:hypothetical protein PPERSA_06253 [Pseudocohnilembus persalinus]|eukprot:KRX06282.1 hypothetical protein PPERSA_06253 [Pseudocohnilembus persalinus]
MEIEQTQLQQTINQEINKNNKEKFQVKKEDSMTNSIDINDPFFELKYIFKEICKNQDQGSSEETKQIKKISYKEKQLINQKKILEIRQNLKNNQEMEQKLQQINKVQKKYAGLIFYAPQKFLNVETCYRLYDFMFSHQQKICPGFQGYQKMVQFVKSDGSLLVIDTFCEHLIHENNIVIRLNFHGNDLFLDHNPVETQDPFNCLEKEASEQKLQKIFQYSNIQAGLKQNIEPETSNQFSQSSSQSDQQQYQSFRLQVKQEYQLNQQKEQVNKQFSNILKEDNDINDSFLKNNQQKAKSDNVNPNVNFTQLQGNVGENLEQFYLIDQQQGNIIKNIRDDLFQELKGSIKQRNTATVVELKDIQKNKKKNQSQCKIMYLTPQRFRNITTHYRILDDIFISEAQIMKISNNYDLEIGGEEPINTFKFIDFAIKNNVTNTIQFAFSERPNYNSPPVEYLIERFKSMSCQDLYKVSQKLTKYIQNKKQFQKMFEENKFPQQFYMSQKLTQQQKDFYINQLVNEYNVENNLFYLQQYSIDKNGYFRLENNHLTTLTQKMFKVTEDEVMFSLLQGGYQNFRSHEQSFKQNLQLLDLPFYGKDEQYIDLEFIGENEQKALYSKLKQTRFFKYGMLFVIIQLQNYNQILPLDPKQNQLGYKKQKGYKGELQ